jgi:hypothetical protein
MIDDYEVLLWFMGKNCELICFGLPPLIYIGAKRRIELRVRNLGAKRRIASSEFEFEFKIWPKAKSCRRKNFEFCVLTSHFINFPLSTIDDGTLPVTSTIPAQPTSFSHAEAFARQAIENATYFH